MSPDARRDSGRSAPKFESDAMPAIRSLLGIFCTVCLVLVSSMTLAQDLDLGNFSLQPRGKKSRAKPEFTVTLTPAEAKAGETVTLAVRVKLPAGFYIYGTEGEFGGKTEIKTTETGLEAIDAAFVPDHPPKTAFEPLFGTDVSKFFDEVTWSRKYRVQSGVTEAKVQGTLEGQYCSSGEGGMCVPIRPPFAFSQMVAVAGGAPAPTATQSGPPQYSFTERPIKNKAKDNPIEFTIALTPTNPKVGETVTLSIAAKLDDGWHTFGMDHVGVGGTPTEIFADNLRGLKAVDETFLPSTPSVAHEEAGLTLKIHEKSITWSRKFEVTDPADYGLSGEIAWQTCIEGRCLPVRTFAFTFPHTSGTEVRYGPSAAAALPDAAAAEGPRAAIADPVVPDAETVAAVPDAEPVRQGQPQDKGLLPFILTAIGFGFVSLLTPCVFPMVPITVSFFLKQSEKQHSSPVLLAGVYGGTIILTFTIIGVGVAAIFGASQLNALANGFWVNAFIGTVFVIFGLNMLGMYEIRVPSSLLTMTATRESAGGYLGAIFMALTFTLTSFTCTFAFAGSLLVAAAQGEIFWPVVGMAAFGSAFASPFVVLALLPKLLKGLPKSGGWMNTVKVVMGLIEIGAAVKFFSVADPAQVFFDHTLVLLIWLILAAVTGLYLLGQFRLPHDTPVEKISVFRLVTAMSFLGLAGLLSLIVIAPHVGGGGAIRNLIVAFAPPNLNQEETDNVPGPEITHHGLTFGLNLNQMIPYAEEKQLPLFLDFTGINCVNCRQMEHLMAQPEWRDRLRKFAGVQLYVDTDSIPKIPDVDLGRKIREQNLKLQEEWFGDVTMPAYAVVSPDGKTVFATYEGAETARTSGTFVKFLDDGYNKWQRWRIARAMNPAAPKPANVVTAR